MMWEKFDRETIILRAPPEKILKKIKKAHLLILLNIVWGFQKYIQHVC